MENRGSRSGSAKSSVEEESEQQMSSPVASPRSPREEGDVRVSQKDQAPAALMMMGEEEEEREVSGKKHAMRKSRHVKSCLRELMGKREQSETRMRENLPHCLIPCLTCWCVGAKMAFYGLLEPYWLLIPIVCVTSVISFFMRLFRCPCGQDLVYSCMEFLLVVDLCIGVYWEVDWWREVERAEKPHEAV